MIEQISPAGIKLWNRYVRYFLIGLEEVMGEKGLDALLRLSGQTHLKPFPPDDTDRITDITEFSLLNAAIEEMGGRVLGHGIARRAGKAAFYRHLTGFGGSIGAVDEPAIQMLPLKARFELIAPVIVGLTCCWLEHYGAVDHSDHIECWIETCPCCWGRLADKRSSRWADRPICMGICGMFEGALLRAMGKHFPTIETECKAHGAKRCVFKIDKTPQDDDPPRLETKDTV